MGRGLCLVKGLGAGWGTNVEGFAKGKIAHYVERKVVEPC